MNSKYVENKLVFDIGAYDGSLTDAFLLMEANMVIAVEPQAVMAQALRDKYKDNPKVAVVQCAIGEKEVGDQRMFVATGTRTISTLSEKWKNKSRFAHYGWNADELVSMITLENLVNTYGNPGFVKIDAEGYEYEVLSTIPNIKTPVPALCFEYTAEFLDDAQRCMRLLGEYIFAYSFGESFVPQSTWSCETNIIESLRSVRQLNPQVWGNVFARRADNGE